MAPPVGTRSWRVRFAFFYITSYVQGRQNHGDKGGSCPFAFLGRGQGGSSAFPLKIYTSFIRIIYKICQTTASVVSFPRCRGIHGKLINYVWREIPIETRLTRGIPWWPLCALEQEMKRTRLKSKLNVCSLPGRSALVLSETWHHSMEHLCLRQADCTLWILRRRICLRVRSCSPFTAVWWCVLPVSLHIINHAWNF